MASAHLRRAGKETAGEPVGISPLAEDFGSGKKIPGQISQVDELDQEMMKFLCLKMSKFNILLSQVVKKLNKRNTRKYHLFVFPVPRSKIFWERKDNRFQVEPFHERGIRK